MKHSINEEVTMRHDLIVDEEYGENWFTEEMTNLLGRNVTISNIVDGNYAIKESRYLITDEMLEESFIPELPEMKHLPELHLTIFAYKGVVGIEMIETQDNVVRRGNYFNPHLLIKLKGVRISQEAIDILKQMKAGNDAEGVAEIYNDDEAGPVLDVFYTGEGIVISPDTTITGSRWDSDLLEPYDGEVNPPEDFKEWVDEEFAENE